MKKRFFPTVALIFAVVVFMLLSTGCHKPGNGEGTESSGVDVPATSGGDTTTEGLGDYRQTKTASCYKALLTRHMPPAVE